MKPTLAVHILAGSVSLLSGFVALYAAKGATLHRKSGMVFVYAMLVMCTAGAFMAAVRASAWSVVNMCAALLTSYLVLTSLATVSRPAGWSREIDVALMGLASAIGVTCLTFGVIAIAGGGNWNGVPAFPFFLFGIFGVLGSVGDLRVIRFGALRGAPRLARHLWRMSFALFVATMSFFIGQMKVIPKPIRIPGLLALPVVAVLVTMLYWMWRVRIRRSLRGIIRVAEPTTA